MMGLVSGVFSNNKGEKINLTYTNFVYFFLLLTEICQLLNSFKGKITNFMSLKGPGNLDFF